MVDMSRERRYLREAVENLPPGSTALSFRVSEADRRDGVQFAFASRDVETADVIALSGHIPRATTIELIRALCKHAGLPVPWDGRKIR